ncbi:MAG: phosphonate ABC transporter ATP-binding protein [Peptoniphilus sp.]|nr:phosphonate ABC transporter ATP-binding protein [Peptoniphilus sp.]
MSADKSVEIKDLYHTYTDENNMVLKGIDLEVCSQEFCVLLGKSGSGKSTLLRCINGLNTPLKGDILIQGERVTKKNLRQKRRHLGMIFQEYNLVNRLTVLENVLCGTLASVDNWRAGLRYFKNEEKDQAYCLLEKVGLENFAHVRVDQLSGGQKQRVGIARALAQNPRIILADEPVSSLDPVTSEEILTLLLNICKSENLTVLITLHQLQYARMFGERIIGLKKGRIMFDNDAADLNDDAVDQIYERSVSNG